MAFKAVLVASPLRIISLHNFSRAIPVHSSALIFSSSPLLYLSTPFHCFTHLLRSIANHFFAFAMLYLPWQFLTHLRLCTSSLGPSLPLRFHTLPLRFHTLPLRFRTSLYRGQSRLIRFSAQQHICCAVRFYSIAFLFLSIAPHFSYTQFRCG